MDAPATAPPGPRVLLARLAGTAALRCAGVAALDPRAAYATRSGAERAPGVLAFADGDAGRYAVSVHLHAHLVDDLQALGAEVVVAVRAAAADGGLADRLGPVRVVVSDLVLPEAPA